MRLIDNTVEALDNCRGRHLLMVWYEVHGGVIIENVSWNSAHRPQWRHPAQPDNLTSEELVRLCGGVKQWRVIFPLQTEPWEEEVERLTQENKAIRTQTYASASTRWPPIQVPPEIMDQLVSPEPSLSWQEVSNEEGPAHQDWRPGAAQDSSVADTDFGDTGVLDSAG